MEIFLAFEKFFLFFLFYSFIGWTFEVILGLVEKKKFVNRGFFIGPYCPIYGFGVILISLLLEKYMSDLIITFIMSILICGTLEYITSYFMEKIFNARWWDYSHMKFNINGRVCLETLLPFGIVGTFFLYVVNPVVLNFLEGLPAILFHLLFGFLFVIFVADIITSFKIIFNLKEISKELKDNTEEISNKVKNIIRKKSILHRRVVYAFPNIKDKVDIKEWIENGLEKIEKKLNESKEKLNILQKRIENKIKIKTEIFEYKIKNYKNKTKFKRIIDIKNIKKRKE